VAILTKARALISEELQDPTPDPENLDSDSESTEEDEDIEDM
jgi:hypothetical protein